MRTSIRIHLKVITSALTLMVLYNEILIYHIHEWPKLECENDKNCTKILIAADLQLLGEKYDKSPLSSLFNWDCDRYLSKTYKVAMSYFVPNVVIFLGDVIDEGTIATDEEYQRYIKRLAMITAPKYPAKYIWIPGDNDIGGEDEPIYESRINLFKKTFRQSDYSWYGDIDIYHFNKMINTTPELPSNHTIDVNKTNIIISHFPVLTNYNPESILNKFHPSVIFSGHRHESIYISKNKHRPQFSNVKMISPNTNEELSLHFGEELYEISVPTCSYRMGVNDMGYGAAVIDTYKKTMQYSVLWSPRRFRMLRSYFAAFAFLSLYLFLLFLYLIIFRRLCYQALVQLGYVGRGVGVLILFHDRA